VEVVISSVPMAGPGTLQEMLKGTWVVWEGDTVIVRGLSPAT
jgi:hypothetical protein